MAPLIKDIEGFEGLYKICEDGSVLSYKRKKPKVLAGSLVRGQYKGYVLYKENKAYLRLGHRLVAEAFLNNPERKPCVNHIDFNRQNNHVKNLEWCTQKENIQHFVTKGSRFDLELVKEIRERHKKGESQRSLARKLNKSLGAINHIVNRKSFKEV
jgi:hypothetical protein